MPDCTSVHMDHEAHHPVVIVGAGPTGLTLALGLARSGVSTIVLERKTRLNPHSRATVIFPRTLEILSHLGALDRFLSEGNRVPHIRVRLAPRGEQIVHFDFTDLTDDTATPFALALAQDRTEHLLLDAATATGLVDVRFGTEVLGFDEGPQTTVVRARSADGESEVRASFLVGADGAHSTVRETLGLELKGKTYPTRALLADVRVPSDKDQEEFWPALVDEYGLVVGIRFGSGIFRIVADAVDDRVTEHTLDAEVDRLTRRLFGAPAVETIWGAIYHKHQRCAWRFRVGRAVLAGDAAHLNSPAGGQGMNSSIQDGHNLAWKLATAITCSNANIEALLTSYDEERRDYINRQIQPFTDLAERFETAPSSWREFIVRVGGKLAGMSRSAHAMTRRLSMLDVEYRRSALFHDLPSPVGRRVPNAINGAGKRLFENLEGPTVLHAQSAAQASKLATALNAADPLDADTARLSSFFGRTRFVAVVRPDQIVGWVGDGDALNIDAARAAVGLQ
jgi:3-(3-hydroxy-phenyl)propionate hydroxylase